MRIFMLSESGPTFVCSFRSMPFAAPVLHWSLTSILAVKFGLIPFSKFTSALKSYFMRVIALSMLFAIALREKQSNSSLRRMCW